MDIDDYDLPDDAEHRAISEALRARFAEELELLQRLHQGPPRKGRPVEMPDVMRMFAVVGFARHIHDLAEGVRVLEVAGLRLQAVPLVRSMWETAITSSWLSQGENHEGIVAFHEEMQRLHLNLVENMKRTSYTDLKAAAEALPPEEPIPLASDDTDSAKQFKILCDDLVPGGPDAYLAYQMFSHFTHPTSLLAGLYWDPIDPDGRTLPYLSETPRSSLIEETLYSYSIPSMIWSARAVSFHLPIDRRKAYASFLRDHAKRVGVADVLTLSHEYAARRARTKRKKRQRATQEAEAKAQQEAKAQAKALKAGNDERRRRIRDTR